MPDDHSKVAPLLPIPNRTVKRLCADDSADSRVKVGHRQALIQATPMRLTAVGVVLLRHWSAAGSKNFSSGLQMLQNLCHNARLC